MTKAERVEAALILLAGSAVWFVAPMLSARPELGSIISAASVTVLAQGLIRDLYSIYRARRTPVENRRARCICVESTIGVTGVAASLCLLGLGFSLPVAMSRVAWTMLIFMAMILGFLIKDWVLTLKPFALKREKGHGGVIVSWRG